MSVSSQGSRITTRRGRKTIAERDGQEGAGEITGFDLLYAPGSGPDAEDIRVAVGTLRGVTISHDATQTTDAAPLMFELVSNGLTFDLVRHAANRSGRTSAAAFHFDLPDEFAPDVCKVLRLRPGPHLSGAETSLPVVRAQAGIAAALASAMPDVAALAWAPSGMVAGKGHTLQTITAWSEGGAFPAPGLVTFRKAMGGALQSSGMAYLTGQELRLEGDLVGDEDAAIRLAARLVDQLVPRGRMTETEQATGPSGEMLRIEPSANGRFVRVWPG